MILVREQSWLETKECWFTEVELLKLAGDLFNDIETIIIGYITSRGYLADITL